MAMQPKESHTPSPEGPIPSLEPRDVDTLAYIHSNKFITTRLFHRKFHPTQSYTTASVHLRELVSRGLLLKTRKFQNDETYFYLARPALKHLSGLARILTSPEIRSPRINPIEREHDKRVIHYEGPNRYSTRGFQGPNLAVRLRNALWPPDGLEKGPGRGPVVGHLAGAKLHRVHHRTPDGYFEAEIGRGDPTQ